LTEEVRDNREEQAREIAGRLLTEGNVDGVLALLHVMDHVVPHLFTSRRSLPTSISPATTRWPASQSVY